MRSARDVWGALAGIGTFVLIAAVPVTLALAMIWLVGRDAPPPRDGQVVVTVVRVYQGDELIMAIPFTIWRNNAAVLSDSSVVTVERIGTNIITGEGRITTTWAELREMARDTVVVTVSKSMLAAVQ